MQQMEITAATEKTIRAELFRWFRWFRYRSRFSHYQLISIAASKKAVRLRLSAHRVERACHSFTSKGGDLIKIDRTALPRQVVAAAFDHQ